ncbi:hypothetical protein H9C73_10870 [Marinobacterium sp. AK62]|uniref:Transmembrane cytochrome oxidase associated protein n=1 Tax=Marinobacterium alkalitolerans TaxID=1542925 RepID=A0ABS3ZC13_9GAMM|nr:hypothetical protein [Marinobacterium alkalitolerans]MBP0049238.1 hypothetical protein [Marinobacterium alkalitolerans]
MTNRNVFWAIWILGLLPVALAITIWATGVGLPQGHTNRGVLLEPIQPLQQWGGDAEAHTGHWTLLLVPGNACTQDCDAELEDLRRVHDALGRESTRVRVMPHSAPELEAGVWVVDPLGNLVLQYPLSFKGKALLGDMRRLLKASRLG